MKKLEALTQNTTFQNINFFLYIIILGSFFIPKPDFITAFFLVLFGLVIFIGGSKGFYQNFLAKHPTEGKLKLLNAARYFQYVVGTLITFYGLVLLFINL
ncbi:MAG: hypothetical protein ACK5MW_00300 [Enterococcus sp.]